MKLPIPTTTQVKRVSQTLATGIDSFATLLKNVLVSIVDGKAVASRRKGVLTLVDASAVPITPTFGRGIHWSPIAAGNIAYYVANYNGVYETGYATPLGTFGTGSSLQQNNKMYFTSVDDGTYDTVVIDPTVNMGAALEITGTFTSITAALPTPLNGGGAWINGRFFVCSENRIYNSNLNDVTAGYTDFVSAERCSDLIKNIVRHHDHIVAFGSNSIEFFYSDENPGPTGSPLRRRQDLYYDVGLLDMSAIDVANDVIYFIGSGVKEGIGLYKISNFQLSRVPVDERLNRYLQTDYSSPNALNYLTAFSYDSKVLICVTHCDNASADASVTDQIWSFVIEEDGRYYVWDTDGVSESTEFPLIGAVNIDAQTSGGTIGSGTKWYFRGLLANGDIVKFKEFWDGPDTFKDDLGGTEVEFTSTIEFSDFDGDVTGWKFCHAVEPLGDYEAGCTFDLSWSDEGGAYNTPRTLTKANRQRAVGCGRFSRRKFRLTSTDDSDVINERMELEGLDVNISPGQY